jgi:glutathione synthase/RimK-type ligase-like ATP-grasp enzyme
MVMETIDFAIGWPDPRDPADLFINSLQSECRSRRMRFLCVDEVGLERAAREVKRGNLRIKFYLDMASETFDAQHPFTKFCYLVKDVGARVVDDPDKVKAAADKSITHFDLLRSKLPVPYTVIIRHWEPSRKLTAEEKDRLGTPFVIKPALGYGQKGVKVIRDRRSRRPGNTAPGTTFSCRRLSNHSSSKGVRAQGAIKE